MGKREEKREVGGGERGKANGEGEIKKVGEQGEIVREIQGMGMVERG